MPLPKARRLEMKWDSEDGKNAPYFMGGGQRIAGATCRWDSGKEDSGYRKVKKRVSNRN